MLNSCRKFVSIKIGYWKFERNLNTHVQQHMVDKHYSSNLKPWSAGTLLYVYDFMHMPIYCTKILRWSRQEIFISRLWSYTLVVRGSVSFALFPLFFPALRRSRAGTRRPTFSSQTANARQGKMLRYQAIKGTWTCCFKTEIHNYSFDARKTIWNENVQRKICQGSSYLSFAVLGNVKLKLPIDRTSIRDTVTLEFWLERHDC